MQTFLPYQNFRASARVLDKKRCWKQVVEASQILDVLEGRKSGWKNHPAVKMWDGHAHHFKIYFNAFLKECKEYHNINTKYNYFDVPFQSLVPVNEFPWWLGDEKFHRAMRARLIKKDRDYYLPLWPEDDGFNNGDYFWPVMESKTFRVI